MERFRYVSPILRAIILYQMDGKTDEMFDLLELGYEARDNWMHTFNTDRYWQFLRSDPRFQALLRRMHFPEK